MAAITDTPTRNDSARTRDRLLTAAARLFHDRGINATGVDRVLSESGVAKGSLYHHFGGKQGLVVAYLEREREQWQATTSKAAVPGPRAATGLDHMFEGVADAVRAGTFSGCPFTNAVIERPDDEDVRAVVEDYCEKLRCHIAHVIGALPTDAVVAQIFTVYNGALTSAKLTKEVAYVHRARDVARRLVESEN